MTWVKLHDGLPRLPEYRGLPANAKVLYVASLCHASEQLTDGRVDRADLAMLAATSGVPQKCHVELVAAGLWVEDDEGWSVMQPGFGQQGTWRCSREKRESLRAKRAAAGRKGGKARPPTTSKEESKVLSSLQSNGEAERLASSQTDVDVALSEGERATTAEPRGEPVSSFREIKARTLGETA